uniref:Chromosome 17 open reading frame 50 n=1 Tax=Pelusios castaneus TaxID=367368 RepID=A0A8C8S1Q3_9SAUR
MSWWRKEEEEEKKKETVEEETEEPAAVKDDVEEEENTVSYSSLSPQTSSAEQVQELAKTEENWFWGWFSPFSLFSGLTMPADRYGKESQQEPVCCLLEKKRPSGNTCPECEILFCRQCDMLHYNPGFIEHCILDHDSSKAAAALGRTEDEEIKRK